MTRPASGTFNISYAPRDFIEPEDVRKARDEYIKTHIISKLVEKNYTGHVVAVSSNAANWTSWPNISVDRLTYNNSKHAISSFVYGIKHRNYTGKYSVIEPSKFKSPMSNFQGLDISLITAALDSILNNDTMWNVKI
jgi:NAD(P)-dependent dehydrogenase (short-subunit alcohol dehydrogenase family)